MLWVDNMHNPCVGWHNPRNRCSLYFSYLLLKLYCRIHVGHCASKDLSVTLKISSRYTNDTENREVLSIPSHRGYLVEAALATDNSMAALCFWVHSSTAFFVILVLLLPLWLPYSWGYLAHSSLRDCSVITIIITLLVSFRTAFSGANSVWVNIWFWKIFCRAYLQSKSLLAPQKDSGVLEPSFHAIGGHFANIWLYEKPTMPRP